MQIIFMNLKASPISEHSGIAKLSPSKNLFLQAFAKSHGEVKEQFAPDTILNQLHFASSYRLKVILVAVITWLTIGNYASASIHAAKTGFWSATSTWSGGVVPGASDDVEIDGGYTVTVDATGQACNTLNIGPYSSGTLTFSGTSDLTAVDIYVSSSGATGTLTMTSGATLTANTINNNGGTSYCDFSAGNLILIYTSSSFPSGASSFNNLTIVSGTFTAQDNTTISGTLTVNADGTFDPGTYTVSGTITGNGILNINKTGNTDDFTATYSGTLSLNNMTLQFGIAGGGQQKISNSISCKNIIVANSNGLQINGTPVITVFDTISTKGPIIPASSVVINTTITSPTSNGTIYVTAAGNSNDLTTQYPGTIDYAKIFVKFSGTSAQAINSTVSPRGFIISNSIGVTFNANETPGVSGTSIGTNAVLTVASAYHLTGSITGSSTCTLNVTATGNANDLTTQYTGYSGGLTINFCGTAAQAINSIFTPEGLIIANTTSTVTIGGETTVGTLGAGNTVVNSGAILVVMTSNTLKSKVSGNGTIKVTKNTSGGSDALSLQYTGALTLTNLIVDFAGTSTQAIVGSFSSKGIIISNTAGIVTVSTNNITVGSAGIVVNSGATLAVLANRTLGGAISGFGTINVLATGHTNDLTTQYTGTLTLTNLKVNFAGTAAQNISTTISPLGFIKSNTGGTVTFNANETPGASGTVVNSGAILAVASSFTLSGNLSGSGTIKVMATGNTNDLTTQYTGTLSLTNMTVIFAGTGSQKLPSGSYYVLNVNNTSGTTLTGDITLTHGLTLSNGTLALGSNNLTLNSGCTITGGSATSYIQITGTGNLIAKNISSATLPIGDEYAPVTISSGGGADYTISLVNTLTASGGSPAVSTHAVGITWTITASTTQTPTLTFQWPGSSEQGGSFDRTMSYVAQRTSPSGTWVPLGSASAAGGLDPYTQTGTATTMTASTAYDFAIGDNNSPLPVELIHFDAAYEPNLVNLTWTTASEINNSHFNIERSSNGQIWETIGKIAGHGNSITANHYNAIDNLAGIVPTNTIYYQLKQVDFNGAFVYSQIKSVTLINNNTSSDLSIYPNPAIDILNISLPYEGKDALLKITNMNGIVVYTEFIPANSIWQKQLDLSLYPAGNYFIGIVTGKKSWNKIVAKN